MKPTYTEQLAKLQLDRIAKRKAFWTSMRKAAFFGICITGLWISIGAAGYGIVISGEWFATQTKLRARVEALERNTADLTHVYPSGQSPSELKAQLDEQKAQIQKLQTPPVNLTVPYIDDRLLNNAITNRDWIIGQ